jgi:hypothetical protein
MKISFASMKHLLILKLIQKPHQNSVTMSLVCLADFLIGCRKNPSRFMCHRRLSKLFQDHRQLLEPF